MDDIIMIKTGQIFLLFKGCRRYYFQQNRAHETTSYPIKNSEN